MVLIETYWNVNLGTTAAMSLTSDSINRNILECKCPDAHAALNFTFVLIETYWNVNFCTRENVILHTVSINRNILECKFH